MESVSKNSKSNKKPAAKQRKAAGAKVIDLKLRSSKRKAMAKAQTKQRASERAKVRNAQPSKKMTVVVGAKSAGAPKRNKAVAAKETKKPALALLPAVEAAVNAVPPYLVTPSAEMLKSFREAGKRSRETARKLERMRSSRAQFLAKPPKSGKKYALDLRIHSPATQGYFSTGGVEPSAAIVRLARVKGIDAIAVTDFYSTASIDDVRSAAEKTKVAIIPGFDLCCTLGSCREVFLTALFSEETPREHLDETLRQLGIPQEMAGNREYCFERDLGEVLAIIEQRGGAVLPSRMDKTPYRQLAIPSLVEKFGFHAFDLVHPEHTEFFQERWPAGGFTFMSFSNANALAQIGSRVASLRLSAPGFQGIRELLARRVGPDA